MLKSLVSTFIPWVIFYSMLGEGVTEIKLSVVLALLYVVIFNRRGLRKGLITDWWSLIFFSMLFVSFFFIRLRLYADILPVVASGYLALTFLSSVFFKESAIYQHVKDNLPKSIQSHDLVKSSSRWLSAIWGGAFLLNAAFSDLQGRAGIPWLFGIIPLLVLIAVIWMTLYYKEWLRNRLLGKEPGVQLERLAKLKKLQTSTGRIIGFRILGKGRPLLLTGGGFLPMEGWNAAFLEHLSRFFQVILYDYPGLGVSTSKKEGHPIEELSDDVAYLLEHLAISRAAIAGFSSGGRVAQIFAIRHPQKVSKLILINTDPGSSEALQATREVVSQLQDAAEKPACRLVRLKSLLFPESLRASYLNKFETLFDALQRQELDSTFIAHENEEEKRWFTTGGALKQLHQIKCPTLILVSKLDEIVPPGNSQQIAAQIPQGKLIEYPLAGHGILWQQPDSVIEEIVRFSIQG